MAKNIDLDALKLMLDELKANGQIGYDETVLGDTLTWDGTDSDVVVADMLHLAFEDLPPIEVFDNGDYMVSGMYSYGQIAFPEMKLSEVILASSDKYICIGEFVMFIYEDNVSVTELGGLTFPKKGVYFMKQANTYLSSLTIEGANCFPTSTPKQIDSKYLPTAENNDVTFVIDSSDSITCNKTFDEVKNIIKNKNIGSINYDITDAYELYPYTKISYTIDHSEISKITVSFNVNDVVKRIVYKSDGTLAFNNK